MGYCTLAEVKTYLRINSDTDDNLITGLIDATDEWINQYTNRKFGITEETTEYVPITNTNINVNGRVLYLDDNYLELAEPPSEVLVSGEDVTSYIKYYGTAPYSELVLSKASGFRFDMVVDPDTELEEQVVITGYFGYSTTVPEPVNQAATVITANFYQAKDREPDNVTKVLDSSGAVVLPIPDIAKVLLDPYRSRFF